jgi:hypothetical protein
MRRTVTSTRRTPLHTITTNDEQVTVLPMTPTELASEETQELIDDLNLPRDSWPGFNPLKGWHIYDAHGEHVGRVLSRGCVMTAEWYDRVRRDWLLAKWGCRRLERAVTEILRLRDEIIRASKAEAEQLQRGEYAAYLERNGLVLDEDGDEMPLSALLCVAA